MFMATEAKTTNNEITTDLDKSLQGIDSILMLLLNHQPQS